jgi:serine/threonine protein kinase
LKPKNVMLVPVEGGETVKILDFGLTRLLDPESELTHLTAMGFQLGTARWMAPEQIRDPSNVGPAADLYALGLILYSMIAGRPPFAGTADEVLHQHLESPPPVLPEAGPLAELVERLLAKDPAHRPENARAVAARLAALDLGATQLQMRPTRGEFSLEVKTAKEEAWAGEDDGEQLGTPTTPLRSARSGLAQATIVPRAPQLPPQGLGGQR